MPYDFDPNSYGNPGRDNNTVLSVSDLNRQAKRLLEVSFPSITVEGELSNFARPRSGHWYFTLKDASAQIRCAMFRGSNMRVKFQPAEGQQVQVRGKISLYEGRGDYQLIVEQMEHAGAGALQRAFEQLKTRLSQEGLFDPAHKKPLPSLPKHIAVVTSATGAAIRDILTVFKRRFPSLAITVVPTAVQGAEAAGQIVKALKQAEQLAGVEAIILARGGGSLEDLWPFNEEIVARAIFDATLPVISGVGHEVDFTIADFVADQRAPTPSAAAEILSPDRQELLSTINGYRQMLVRSLSQQLKHHQHNLTHLRHRLRHPGERLREQSQRLDDLEIRLQNAIQKNLTLNSNRVKQQQSRLHQHSPANTLQRFSTLQQQLDQRLKQAIHSYLARSKQQLSGKIAQLDAYSPLATLQRGYAIALTETGSVINNSSQVQNGDTITTRLASGEITSQVITVSHEQ